MQDYSLDFPPVGTLNDSELALELTQTDALLMSASSLPAFGFTPDPAIHAAITARHAGLEAEHTRRVAS
jgi:hypothetical protein